MERLLVKAIIKIVAKSLALATLIGVPIGIFGYVKQWDSPITYSNAFFIAGGLMIIAGGMSRLTAGEDWSVFQLLSGESFRGMSSGERATFIINVSSQLSTVILGVLTGLLLMLVSAIAAYLF